MKEDDIPTKSQLDAQLIAQDVKDRAKLWRVAEGRLGWPLLVAGLLPLVLLVFGVVLRINEYGLNGFMGKEPSSYFILMGIGLVGLNSWQRTQRQIGALRDLLKSQERTRS